MWLNGSGLAVCILLLLRKTIGYQAETHNDIQYLKNNNQQRSLGQQRPSSLASEGNSRIANNYFNHIAQNELINSNNQVQKQQRNIMPAIVNAPETYRNQENSQSPAINGKNMAYQISKDTFGNQASDYKTVGPLFSKSFASNNAPEPAVNYQDDVSNPKYHQSIPRSVQQFTPTQTKQCQNYVEPLSSPQFYFNDKTCTSNMIPISISPSLLYELLSKNSCNQPYSATQMAKFSNSNTQYEANPTLKSGKNNSQMNAILKLLLPQSISSSQNQNLPPSIPTQNQPSIMSMILSQLQPSMPNNIPLNMIADLKNSNSRSSLKSVLPILLTLLADRNAGCSCNYEPHDYDQNYNGLETSSHLKKRSSKTKCCNKSPDGKKCKKSKKIIKESEEEEEEIENDDSYDAESDEKEE